MEILANTTKPEGNGCIRVDYCCVNGVSSRIQHHHLQASVMLSRIWLTTHNPRTKEETRCVFLDTVSRFVL